MEVESIQCEFQRKSTGLGKTKSESQKKSVNQLWSFPIRGNCSTTSLPSPSLPPKQAAISSHARFIVCILIYTLDLFLCSVLASCYAYSAPSLSHPTGWRLTPISPGNLAHSSVSSDFLTYLVFWLLPWLLPFRLPDSGCSQLLILATSYPAWRAPLGLRSSLPHLPPHLVSARFSEAEDAGSPGASAFSSGFLSPGRPKTQRNMQPWDGWQERRGNWPGKKYSLPQLNQLPWVKPDPFWLGFLLDMKDSIRFTKSTS